MKLFFPICFFAVSILLAGCVGGSGGFVVVEEFSECPLCKAAKEGDSDRVDILLAAGANPNAADNSGVTALIFAAQDGHAKVAKVLLDSGANPNATDNDGWTALMVSTVNEHAEIIKLLLDAGANPNAVLNDTKREKGQSLAGITTLMLAANNGYSEGVNLLLQVKTNIHATDKGGNNALIIAAREGHAEVSKILLSAGVFSDAVQNYGWTALMMAASNGYSEVAKVLLECGASPDKRNNEGINAWHWANRQPIMHAVFYGHLDKVKAGWSPKSCKGRDFNPVAEVPQMANPDAIQSPQTANLGESVFAKVWQSIVVVKSGGNQGSGVVISPNTIATNCHVLGGGKVIVYKHNNRRASTDTVYSASVIKRDDYRDFCILRAQNLNGIPAKIRKYDSLNIGENVYAVGSPQGLDLSLSTGVISQLRQGKDRRLIQTDAAISPGSSGGGLFDSSGNLIGITTEKITDENVEGIAFAIPADLAVGY